ncbi:MAG: hypothetical protein OEW37_05875 [Rhodospirillaceae bacterium]|nr:hypothetical protein [Rhodospirillaceae bacterium]
MHSLYFIAYAIMASFAGLIIVHAQYTRMRAEGTPMSFGFVKVVAAIAIAMWVAAGVTSLTYSYAGAA